MCKRNNVRNFTEFDYKSLSEPSPCVFGSGEELCEFMGPLIYFVFSCVRRIQPYQNPWVLTLRSSKKSSGLEVLSTFRGHAVRRRRDSLLTSFSFHRRPTPTSSTREHEGPGVTSWHPCVVKLSLSDPTSPEVSYLSFAFWRLAKDVEERKEESCLMSKHLFFLRSRTKFTTCKGFDDSETSLFLSEIFIGGPSPIYLRHGMGHNR